MIEKLKLKYRKICNDVQFFYKIMDDWNSFLLANPRISKEEKLRKLEEIKEIEPNLYQAMLEDIYAGLY